MGAIESIQASLLMIDAVLKNIITFSSKTNRSDILHNYSFVKFAKEYYFTFLQMVWFVDDQFLVQIITSIIAFIIFEFSLSLQVGCKKKNTFEFHTFDIIM